MHLLISVTNRHNNRVVAADIGAILIRATKRNICDLENYSLKEIIVNLNLRIEFNVIDAVIGSTIIHLLTEIYVKEILDILFCGYMVKLIIPRLILKILLIILNWDIELYILAIVTCLT